MHLFQMNHAETHSEMKETTSITFRNPVVVALCAALAVGTVGTAGFGISYLSAKQALSATQAENEMLNERVKTIQTETADYNDNIVNMQEKTAELDEKITELNAAKEDLQKQLDLLNGQEREASSQSYQVSEDSYELLDHVTYTTQQENRVTDLILELSQLESRLGEVDSSIMEVAHQVDEAMATYNVPSGNPVDGGILSSVFNPNGDVSIDDGRVHKGIDLSTQSQILPIHATASGIVKEASYHDDYGYYVIIDHLNGYTTLFAHCSTLEVSAGDAVQAGDIVGYTGTTGYSTGIHCHYEVQYEGQYVNPTDFLD